jgi:glyoxylase-like metal-dependent hydrolase (beta-lactamase superfamily II)
MADFEVLPLLDAAGSFTTYEEAFPALGRSGAWQLPFRAFLVRSTHVTALVDCGVGPPGPSWLPDRQGWLLEELARWKVAVERIELVFLTHLHVDHVGWCGSFPNARYVASRTDWEWFATRGERNLYDFHATLEPLRAEGLVDLLDGDGEVAPGLRAFATPGHTPGHMSVRAGDDALLIGDVCVLEEQLADPGLVYESDADGAEAAATRREALALAADDYLAVAASHLPGNGLGWVERAGEGFAWRPSN